MKKTFFILSAIFLIASPVLAGSWDETFYPADQSLIFKSQKSVGMQFAADRQEMMSEKREPGFIRKIGGLASRVVEAPVKFFGLFIGRDKSTEAVTETSQLVLQESEPSEPWMKLDLNSAPDFSLSLDPNVGGYSVFEKSAGQDLVGMNTAEKEGLGNRMMKVQILLQHIIFTDEN